MQVAAMVASTNVASTNALPRIYASRFYPLSHEKEESCEVGENDGNPNCKQGKDCVGIHEAFLLNRLIQDHLEKNTQDRTKIEITSMHSPN